MNYLDLINNITEEYAAPTTKGWPLVGSPFPLMGCISMYLLISLYGKVIMNGRKEVNVKPVMQVYNLGMIIFNVFLLYEILVTTIGWHWICQPADWRQTPNNIRKKYSQVTFLHVYHHATMTVLLWGVTTYAPQGDSFFAIVLNCIVHIIMYTYYFVAALGPQYQKYLWWKIHLTKFQLIQFFLVMIKTISAIYINCNPRYAWWHKAMFAYMITFVILFGNFYYRSYYAKKRVKTN